jgi:hypothetical protein
MKEAYIRTMSDIGADNLFSRISDLFIREPESNHGAGIHYIIDLFESSGGNDGARVVAIVCENLDIPVMDLRNQSSAPIRDIVKRILEASPHRCVILLDTRDNELIQKVRARIASKHCDLRYRRIICCLVDQDVPPAPPSPTTNQLYVPGSINDKMTMLLYHLPEHIRTQSTSIENFRPVAEAMNDYALFEYRVWCNVRRDGTLADFVSTAMYQLARRVRTDPCIDDTYPKFEVAWRRSLATQLHRSLPITPSALCPSIHRVIPIGVSSLDAMKAMQLAIPKNIENPYAITVNSSAVDDQCGTIAITQPMNYTVVHINCMLDPGLLVEVCRELRTGHREVVQEFQSMKKQHDETNKRLLEQLVTMRMESNQQLVTMRRETSLQLVNFRKEITNQFTKLTSTPENIVDEPHSRCSKKWCPNLVTGRFGSGTLKKQCADCLSLVARTSAKRKFVVDTQPTHTPCITRTK